jgi:hypothetical protein
VGSFRALGAMALLLGACQQTVGDGNDPGTPLPPRGPLDADGAEAGATPPPPPPQVPPPPDGPLVDAGDDGSAAAEAAAQALCTTTGVVVCFPFESTATDRSQNAISATVSGHIAFVAGHAGAAVSLDTTSAIRLAPNALFDSPAATIEAWIKRSAASPAGANGVVTDVDGRYSLTILPNGALLCQTSGGQISGGTITNEKWTHVACTVGGGVVRAYVNGAQVASGVGSVIAQPTLAEAIGGNSPSGEPFVGELDSLRVFKTARTAAEIAAAAAL